MEIQSNLRREIEHYAETHPGNRSRDGGRYFDRPLVGFASATDPLFMEYKRIIGAFHRTPAEVLEQTAAEDGQTSGTVVCWVLPITEPTRVSNREQDRHPSREWAHTRDFGEKFNDGLRNMVVDFLNAQGGHAAAPMLCDWWVRVDDPRVGLASTWSERHAAFAAGLGTFSLNDGFITPRGIAHRCGSVVTDIVMVPSNRSYGDHRENCLTCRGVECGVCITRCPVDAISGSGHDKDRCRWYIYGPEFRALKERYGVSEVGCGLCQTDVPCESVIPEG